MYSYLNSLVNLRTSCPQYVTVVYLSLLYNLPVVVRLCSELFIVFCFDRIYYTT